MQITKQKHCKETKLSYVVDLRLLLHLSLQSGCKYSLNNNMVMMGDCSSRFQVQVMCWKSMLLRTPLPYHSPGYKKVVL